MSNNIEHNIIEKYFNFIKNCTSYQLINTAIFYPIGDYYYLFYNENIGTNANDMEVQFENDGIYKKNGEIYFYVYFKISNIIFYLENIKKNDIIILDEDFSISRIYKKKNNDSTNKNNRKSSFLNLFTSHKFYNIANNIKIIQAGILRGIYTDCGLNPQKITINHKENHKENINNNENDNENDNNNDNDNENDNNNNNNNNNNNENEIEIEIQFEQKMEKHENKKVCKSNTSSFDDLEDIDFPYYFIKKNFSSKELEDYDYIVL
jgi:hypothetical protein